jgi:hypothetical protein
MAVACHREPRVRRISPHETATYVVDGARIAITYGRPSTRGRPIFGALVPYNVVWMPGADEATILRSDTPLQFADVVLRRGTYSLYALPSETTWRLIINRQTGQWHTTYNPDQDVVRTEGRVDRAPQRVEQLTIAALPRPGGGELRIEWDALVMAAPFRVRR